MYFYDEADSIDFLIRHQFFSCSHLWNTCTLCYRRGRFWPSPCHLPWNALNNLSAGINMENIDYKIIKWDIQHDVWLQNICVDFVLDAWQWDACRSKATLCVQGQHANAPHISRTQAVHDRFSSVESSMAESVHAFFACHVEVNDHAPNERSQKSKVRWDRAPHATYTNARNTKVHDLIVVSGIGWVIEQKPSKKSRKTIYFDKRPK